MDFDPEHQMLSKQKGIAEYEENMNKPEDKLKHTCIFLSSDDANPDFVDFD